MRAEDLTWQEFTALLSGISPETPLGQIVSIRSEEDQEIIKHFTKEQIAIRNEWRNRENNRVFNSLSEKVKEKMILNLQEKLKGAFGNE